MSEFECQVNSIEPLTKTVFKVELTPKAEVSFNAGQYILVHMSDEDKRPFSIANAAYDNNRIELHIGADASNTYATQVLERMREQGSITLSGGHGEAFYQPTNAPVILIAGGTGFSYTYSILQQALKTEPNADITLYWGGKQAEDLYYMQLLISLSEKHPQFTFIPVIQEDQQGWTGRVGLVHEAVMADIPKFDGQQVYVAGRFEMAKVIREDFTALGLPKEQLIGDAFAYI